MVKPIHQTLKEEILESGHLSRAQWANRIQVKVQQYMKTDEVKKMVKEWEGRLSKGAAVTEEHICAVILYCDCTDLCTDFSATFRQENVFESIESVKQRHSHFAIFGRLLVELVVDFGSHDRCYHIEENPFFCGLDRVLNIGSLAVTLNGPCSTSAVGTVALNFATTTGVILKFENDAESVRRPKFFDCSWISEYFEESERLFIAGKFSLRIVSIIIVRSAQNYQQMVQALFLFDAMISGIDLWDCKVKPELADVMLICKLIVAEVNDAVDTITEFDKYLKNEWALFLQRKKEIVLEWCKMQRHLRLFSPLIAFDLVKCEKNKPAEEKANVFKADWISIFPNVRTINIVTGHLYKFRLEALLDSMKRLPHRVGTVIVNDWGEWAQDAFDEDIKQLFAESGWSAECKEKEKVLVFKLKSEMKAQSGCVIKHSSEQSYFDYLQAEKAKSIDIN